MARDVVWVVGSGFSQPLGGPTLASLFSAEAHENLIADLRRAPTLSGDADENHPFFHARDRALGDTAVLVRRLYLYGTRYDRGAFHADDKKWRREGDGERLWNDAESFIDQIETAALNESGASAARLRAILRKFLREEKGTVTDRNQWEPPSMPKVAAMARRLLALETSRFLLDADQTTERWAPYRRWYDQLSRGGDDVRHTVITFNYDLLLELLGLRKRVVLPGDATWNRRGVECVLKLHGSVNWMRRADGTIVMVDPSEERDFPLMHDDGTELVIAPPGPSKARMCAESFETLWTAAETRLRRASAVVFMGYRFPETDNEALRRLLDALSEAPNPARHIVLGPNPNSHDAVRLAGLLAWANKSGYPARVHPLYAQDFMTVFRVDELFSHTP